jgi:hypothetical protein
MSTNQRCEFLKNKVLTLTGVTAATVTASAQEVQNSIAEDEIGKNTAANLGKRITELAAFVNRPLNNVSF